MAVTWFMAFELGLAGELNKGWNYNFDWFWRMPARM